MERMRVRINRTIVDNQQWSATTLFIQNMSDAHRSQSSSSSFQSPGKKKIFYFNRDKPDNGTFVNEEIHSILLSTWFELREASIRIMWTRLSSFDTRILWNASVLDRLQVNQGETRRTRKKKGGQPNSVGIWRRTWTVGFTPLIQPCAFFFLLTSKWNKPPSLSSSYSFPINPRGTATSFIFFLLLFWPVVELFLDLVLHIHWKGHLLIVTESNTKPFKSLEKKNLMFSDCRFTVGLQTRLRINYFYFFFLWQLILREKNKNL